MGVYAHLEQRDLIQQRIERAQRAQPLAEGAVEHHAAHNDCQQNAGFPCEQLAQRGADARIGQGEGNGASSTPCGQRYLQKNGSPMPSSLTASNGSSTTMTSSTAYFK